ncbi:MAG TPA: CAP domain-containing protein [Candidatus Acidoferrales bacterium]|nr:CAP domain-containing protein [Candidatus Acidoferrales bacterium]
MADHTEGSKGHDFNSIQELLRLDRSGALAGCLALFLVLLPLAGLVLPAEAAPQHRTDGPSGSASDGARLVNTSSEADVPTADLEQIATRMLRMVNDDRSSPSALTETKGDARPLQWDPQLAAVARGHSEEMAATGVFSHRGADGSLPMNRVSRAGIHWLATGENIAKAGSVAQAETLFMAEPKFQPNHRGNILDRNYNRVGIGIARAADGSLYITQEFAEIP